MCMLLLHKLGGENAEACRGPNPAGEDGRRRKVQFHRPAPVVCTFEPNSLKSHQRALGARSAMRGELLIQ